MNVKKPPSKIVILDDHAIVHLSQGLVSKISLRAVPLVSPYRWYATYSADKDCFYAKGEIDGKSTQMHRVIMGLDRADSRVIDHIDGYDPLDNRDTNLRICTSSQNQHNRKKNKNNSSGFKGVHKHRKTWVAGIRVNNKLIHLGVFADPVEGAKAYDEAALELHGEFAVLNFPLRG